MEKADVAIVGAGPAGLGAALGARRAGAGEVVVFERQAAPGLTPKGEVVREDPVLQEILPAGIYERCGVNLVTGARFFSPSEKRYHLRRSPHPERVIDFTRFIGEIAGAAEKAGVRIETAASVREIVVDGGLCRGLVYEKGGKLVELRARTVIGAGGCRCPSMGVSKLNRRGIDCPILKTHYEGLNIPDPARMELFVDADRGLPPGVGYIFPRSRTAAEVGYVVFADCMKEGLPEAGPELDRLFGEFLARHDLFREMLGGAERTMKGYHYIPMGGHAADEMPALGLLTAGDRASHITGGSGSGVNASLRMGLLIGGLAGEMAAAGTPWTPETAEKVGRKIVGDRLRKKLELEFKLIRPFRKFAFRLLGTPRSLDLAWPAVSFGMRLV